MIISLFGKIINGNCNTITNINVNNLSGVLSVVRGGTGYSSLVAGAVLIGTTIFIIKKLKDNEN